MKIFQILSNKIKNLRTIRKHVLIIMILAFVIGGILSYQALWLKRQKSTLFQMFVKTETRISKEKIKNAIDVCNKIRDKEIRTVCIGIAKGSSKACDTFGGERIPNCHALLALRIADKSICEKSKLDKFGCLALYTKDYEKCRDSLFPNNCYRDVALLKREPEGCKYITTEFDYNLCVAIVERKSEYCIYPEKLKEPKEYCYIKIATLTEDSSICQMIEHEKEKLCVAMVKKEKGEINCAECLWCCDALAVLTQDASLCQNRDDCYWRVAIGVLDILPVETLF
jgi:hypothetical protein